MATHSSVLAWRIPGTGEPGGLPSMGSHRVGHDGSDLAAAAAVAQSIMNPPAMQETWMNPWVGRCPEVGHGNPLQYSCLENPHGQRSLLGPNPWGHKESDMTE